MLVYELQYQRDERGAMKLLCEGVSWLLDE